MIEGSVFIPRGSKPDEETAKKIAAGELVMAGNVMGGFKRSNPKESLSGTIYVPAASKAS